MTDRPGAEPDVTRYTVVHTKSLDGKWQMAFARDTSLTQEGNAAAASEPAAGAAVPGGNGAAQPANFERLKPLSLARRQLDRRGGRIGRDQLVQVEHR